MSIRYPGQLYGGLDQAQIPDSHLGYGDEVKLSDPMPLSFSEEWLREAPPRSPGWWVKRLLAQLDGRMEKMRLWDAYYEGDQPLAFASEKFREAFGGRFRAFSSNFCSLVVDGTRERMEVTGFQLQRKRSTAKAWSIWQENSMDAASLIAHTEALIKSEANVLVEPQPLDGTPRITVEDPLDSIVAGDPQDPRQRRAALKRLVDDDGHLVVYLYMPDTVWKLRSQQPWRPSAGGQLVLEPASDVDFPQTNRLGVVPMVSLINRPRLKAMGQSEIKPVLSNQDAVNKYRADALVAAEFAAFRQRWGTGIEIPEDPQTGLPIEPFKAAVDRLWLVPPPDPEDPNPPEPRFGEFSATDLTPYQTMIESEIGAISSISRLPYHYLLGQPSAVPPSGESLKSSEAGLIKKVRTQMTHFGEGWEEVMRLCLKAIQDPGADDLTSSTQWRDPETRNEQAHADSTTKLYGSGIITRDESRMEMGYQPDGLPDRQQAGAQETPAHAGEEMPADAG